MTVNKLKKIKREVKLRDGGVNYCTAKVITDLNNCVNPLLRMKKLIANFF
jgi:hypothetical protein